MSPEQAAKEEVFRLLTKETVKKSISLLVVDEAHCIVQSSPDFRPEYQRLASLRHKLGVPTMALTATPTLEVRKEVPESLGFTDFQVVEMNLNRPEIFLEVRTIQSLSTLSAEFISELEASRGVTILFIQNKAKIMGLFQQLKELLFVLAYDCIGKDFGTQYDKIVLVCNVQIR